MQCRIHIGYGSDSFCPKAFWYLTSGGVYCFSTSPKQVIVRWGVELNGGVAWSGLVWSGLLPRLLYLLCCVWAVSNSCCCRFKYAGHKLNLNFKCRTANNMLCVVIKCQLHKNNTRSQSNYILIGPQSGLDVEFITVRLMAAQASRPVDCVRAHISLYYDLSRQNKNTVRHASHFILSLFSLFE